jgi:hypothetical protein
MDGKEAVPVWDHTISVKAPINCGVALTPSRRDSSSTIFPIEYQRADLRRCEILVRVSVTIVSWRIPHEELHPSCQPSGIVV